jgi:REP element-mobilizing transposase RayT
MPRLSRLDAPGVLHHVIGRGIERRKIFLNGNDYDDFIERLGEAAQEDSIDIYAWAMMPNHCPSAGKDKKQAIIIRNEKASYRLRCKFQQKAPEERASVSKPVQIDTLPGGFVLKGTGSLYTFEFIKKRKG